jgi:hypothetical protein
MCLAWKNYLVHDGVLSSLEDLDGLESLPWMMGLVAAKVFGGLVHSVDVELVWEKPPGVSLCSGLAQGEDLGGQ